MIDKEEVKHIAELARLNLSVEEEEEFSKELSLILDYVGKLEKIDTEKIEPTSHPFEAKNVMREDAIKGLNHRLAEKLRNAAPNIKKGYLKVKTIFKTSD